MLDINQLYIYFYLKSDKEYSPTGIFYYWHVASSKYIVFLFEKW